MTACGDAPSSPPEPKPPVVARVDVSAAQLVVEPGDSVQLTAQGRAADGAVIPGVTFAWRSLDTAVATVNAEGVVGARRRGPVTVAATATGPAASVTGAVAGSVELTVRAVVRRVVVTVADNVATGDTVQAQAIAYDGVDAPMPEVTFSWASSDTVVAAFGGGGALVGRAIGTTAVTATATGPGEALPVARGGTATVAVRLVLAQLAGGGYHNCGVARGGAVHCWGEGAWGRLGTGVSYGAWNAVPTPEPVLTAERFVAADADEEHDSRSGHSCALTADGSVHCWGSGSWGMLGDGRHGEEIPPHFNAFPTRVSGLPPARQVALGAQHSCVLAVDGAAWCAGGNSFAQLGIEDAPEQCAEMRCVLAFTPVSGGLRFRSIVAGGYHSCGLTATGEAWCWGSGGTGQLGTPSRPITSPAPVAVGGGLQFASLAAGSSHTCGLTPDGTAYCWGYNWFGQLGTGESGAAGWKATPTRVTTLQRFVHMQAGMSHTCALTADGTAYCWGENEDGQLGAATTASCGEQGGQILPCSTVPGPVQTPLRFTTLALGVDHTCGMTASGEAYCWGGNERGQLGTGTTTSATTPTKVVTHK